MIRPLLMNGLKSGLRGLVPRKQDIQYLPPNLALHLFLSFFTLTKLSSVSPEELAESVHFGFRYSIADSASRAGTQPGSLSPHLEQRIHRAAGVIAMSLIPVTAPFVPASRPPPLQPSARLVGSS
jgi:hypothetical protein